jgi:hypothetical protein
VASIILLTSYVSPQITMTSVCLWKLKDADATTLHQMELVFGNIANHAGHVMVGTGGGYGLNYALYGGGYYDVKDWHEMLIASIGQEAHYERMARQMKDARAALEDVEYYYMIHFFTDPALWAGGKAIAKEDLAIAFEKAMKADPRPYARTSGFLGVTAHRKKWQARISYGGKLRHLGTFGTAEEAALAYDKAARQCGETKQMNYESLEAAEEAAAQACSAQPPAKRQKTTTSHEGQAAGWFIEGLAPVGEKPWHWIEEEEDWVPGDYWHK